ncbi:Spc24 subunit of Ndc80-domain-containing protein [Geopyxis carbonaria]|nr:Spc24 subunit of Ndc80-domain-containing protein [Geopyxis carbonaria]
MADNYTDDCPDNEEYDETPHKLLPYVLNRFQLSADLEHVQRIESIKRKTAFLRSQVCSKTKNITRGLRREVSVAENAAEIAAAAQRPGHSNRMVALETEALILAKEVVAGEAEMQRLRAHLHDLRKEMHEVEREQFGPVVEGLPNEILRLKVYRELGVDLKMQDGTRGHRVLIRNHTKGDVHIIHVNEMAIKTTPYTVVNQLWDCIG